MKPLAWLSLALLLLLPAATLRAESELIERVAAVVNDDIILLSEVRETAVVFEGRLSNVTDPVERERKYKEILHIALDRMIEERLLEQQIEELKYTVGEAEVDANIRQIMDKNNIPDIETFKEVLRRQGLDWREYRKQVKKQIKRWQFISAKVGGKVKVSDEDVLREYQKSQSKHNKEYEYHPRHILFKVPEGQDADFERRIVQRLNELRGRVADGEDFGELAKKYSQGPTAVHGGDLGWVRAGVTVPEFDKVIRELKESQVSEVVRTRFGYHLIQLVERRELPGEAFEDVKEEIRNRLQEEESDRQMKAWIRSVRNKSYVRVMLDEEPAYPEKLLEKAQAAENTGEKEK